MAIDVDTSQAPALLRFRITGPVPSAEEQEALRADLIARGLLTADSIAAVVKDGMPRRRACLINPGKHLLNPEGRAGFTR